MIIAVRAAGERTATIVIVTVNKNSARRPLAEFFIAMYYCRYAKNEQKDLMHNISTRSWIARLLIGIVTAWNLQAAFAFIFSPDRFISAYELSGTAGETAIRGFGILFLMWNVPYLFALKDPIRYQLALIFALLMQSIGLIGECYIFSTLTVEHVLLKNSILRFIIFDGSGLLLMVIAYWITKTKSPNKD
jgi:hypothetical protein